MICVFSPYTLTQCKITATNRPWPRNRQAASKSKHPKLPDCQRLSSYLTGSGMISSYELSAVVLALQLNDPIHKDGW